MTRKVFSWAPAFASVYAPRAASIQTKAASNLPQAPKSREILKGINRVGTTKAGGPSLVGLYNKSYIGTPITAAAKHGGMFAQLIQGNINIGTRSRVFSTAAGYNVFTSSREMARDRSAVRAKEKAVVHISLKGNKCSVTMTDTKGNKRMGASTGSLEERKGRGRASSLAAEATAEQVGRSARRMGIKSVVVKVKGTSIFRKKKKVIMSFREGYVGDDIGIRTPIVQIHDVTQLPHNGCRLSKRRRV